MQDYMNVEKIRYRLVGECAVHVSLFQLLKEIVYL